DLLAALNQPPVFKVVRLSLRNAGDDIEQWLAEGVPDTWTDVECLIELERLANEAQPQKLRAPHDVKLAGGPDRDEHDGSELDARLATLARTDMGNAKRLTARHGTDIRHCHLWSKWLVYDGRRWKQDVTGEVQRMAKDTAERINDEAATISDPKERDSHL